VLKNGAEHRWNSAESIALLAAIAGLFHDFGKAGMCFQQTLRGESQHVCQPYRHEWISVRLFQAFVGARTDEQWLGRLGQLNASDEKEMLKAVKMDSPTWTCSPLSTLPPLAKVVGWLMLSHHRLPQSLSAQPQLMYCEGWIERQLNTDWNSLNHTSSGKHQWKDRDFKNVWKFPHGTPLKSKTWREKARQIGKRIRNLPGLLHYGSLDNLFTLHLARLSLMLADHVYSSQPAYAGWQDEAIQTWANSDRQTDSSNKNSTSTILASRIMRYCWGVLFPLYGAHCQPLPGIKRSGKGRKMHAFSGKTRPGTWPCPCATKVSSRAFRYQYGVYRVR
jgi:CRISPR-associated endonuclease/helicase Cas3